jgi:hypothetical protein
MTLKFGINTQPFGGSAQYTLNILNTCPFWICSTVSTGAGSTGEEWNLNVDTNGYPISNSIARDGASLSSSYTVLVALNDLGTYLFPGGAGSWTLQWQGRGTFTVTRDATASSSSSPITLNVTPTASGTSSGIGVALSATGISATVTFSGTTVSWSGSSFAADSPVAFQTTGTLPGININQVYYVLAASLGANSFQIATTAGGSPITFSGGSGTHTGFGDWARNIQLCQTKYLTQLAAGEQWNIDYTAKFKGLSPIRFMQMQNTYSIDILYSAVTFSGTTVSWSSASFAANQTVMFLPDSGGTLPTPLTIGTAYYVLQASLTANSFQVATSLGGSPITFSGGSGTFTGVGQIVLTSSDITPKDYLMWAGTGVGFGVNRAGHSFGGPPIEAMCALCNEQNADMWINIPPLADASWNTTASALVSANLNSNLKVYVEKSNEVWSQAAFLTPFYANLGNVLFTAAGNNNNAAFLYGLYSSIQAQAIWKSALGSRVISVMGGQASNDSYLSDPTQGMLPRLATDYGGNSSYWTGQAYTHFDAVCIGGYMNGGEQLPDAWTADSDGGIAKFYQEYNSGGLLPTSASTSHIAGGTSTAYTVTSGQSLPATPPNQTIIYIDFNGVTNGANATLAADGGTAFPLQERWGTALPANYIGQGFIGNGYKTPFVFTSVTASGSVGTPGWRIQFPGWPGPPSTGYINPGLDWASTAAAAYGPASTFGLRLLSYECGQTFSDFGHPDTDQTNYSIAANRSTQMGTLYTTYFGEFVANGFNDVVNHYADVSLPGNESQWGLLENIYQTNYATVPKYQAYMGLLGSVSSPSIAITMGHTLMDGKHTTRPRKIPHH